MSDDFPQPIFVLAPPRSFTTVISGILGQHPELLDSPEFNLFRARTMRRYVTMTRLHTGLHRFVAQVYAGEQTIAAVEMARHWVEARQDRTTAEVHRELCAKVAPRALVQKSPRYMRRLSYMENMLAGFPEARYIHLVRHPRAVSESYLNLHDASLLACATCGAIDASGPTRVADPQILWHDYHLRILRFQEMVAPDRWLRLNGEEFLADLDGKLPAVCEWLGVASGPAALAAMKRPEESPFACFGPINAPFGNDPNFLQSPRLRPFKPRGDSLAGPLSWREDGTQFHPRVVELAREFGYA